MLYALPSKLTEVLYKNDKNNSDGQSIKKVYVTKFCKIRNPGLGKPKTSRKHLKFVLKLTVLRNI